MILLPHISRVGAFILNKRRWHRRFKRGVKTIEVRLYEKSLKKPVVPVPCTHVLLRPGRALLQAGIRENLFGRLCKVIGPFSTPEEAWEEVGGCGLGMSFDNLRRYMTRLRKDRRTKEVLPVVVPVRLYCMEDVQVTKHFKWMHGAGNQPGLLSHEFQSKHNPGGQFSCLFRYRTQSVGAAALQSGILPSAMILAPTQTVVTECAIAAALRQSHRQMSKPACGEARGLKGFNGLRRLGCSRAGGKSAAH
jgi:hypothetical protein